MPYPYHHTIPYHTNLHVQYCMFLSLGAYQSRTARQYNNKVLRSLANATGDAQQCACTRFDTPTGHEINMWKESSRLYRSFCAVSQNMTDGSHGNDTRVSPFGVGGIPEMRQLVASGYQDTACSTTTHRTDEADWFYYKTWTDRWHLMQCTFRQKKNH